MTSSLEGFVSWEGKTIWLADLRRRFLSERSHSYPNNLTFPFHSGVIKKTTTAKKKIPREELVLEVASFNRMMHVQI